MYLFIFFNINEIIFFSKSFWNINIFYSTNKKLIFCDGSFKNKDIQKWVVKIQKKRNFKFKTIQNNSSKIIILEIHEQIKIACNKKKKIYILFKNKMMKAININKNISVQQWQNCKFNQLLNKLIFLSLEFKLEIESFVLLKTKGKYQVKFFNF